MCGPSEDRVLLDVDVRVGLLLVEAAARARVEQVVEHLCRGKVEKMGEGWARQWCLMTDDMIYT